MDYEKIRKNLIDFLEELSKLGKNTNFDKWSKSDCAEWIAWVEKQSEQNMVVVIPKFRVGDVIRPKGSAAEYTIESISGECYHGKGWGLHISCDDDYELVEQKPWSKEDEKIISRLHDIIFDCKTFGKFSVTVNEYSKLDDWLKFLKDRVQPQSQEWKPSDKQMKAIEHICDGNYNVDLDILDSIYKDFRKIREE